MMLLNFSKNTLNAEQDKIVAKMDVNDFMDSEYPIVINQNVPRRWVVPLLLRPYKSPVTLLETCKKISFTLSSLVSIFKSVH
jgi:hypothetical protein